MSPGGNSEVNGTDNAPIEALRASEVEIEEIEAQMVFTEGNLHEAEDVAELLEKLANADAVAEGMESKIDNILQDLDDLLSALDSSTKSPDEAPASEVHTRLPNEEKSSSRPEDSPETQTGSS
ncbi:hypothetical protein CVT26_002197 [Gymnopilus dilepis]|uniref:Uncharacterized protein n=1 Tax=Gymnopilus dilepis TaxID=231916 RepID=A0A409VBG4_9AGAR|nr:hypothetical protein CVT26_002197 [Gymnopilus dilepis]